MKRLIAGTKRLLVFHNAKALHYLAFPEHSEGIHHIRAVVERLLQGRLMQSGKLQAKGFLHEIKSEKEWDQLIANNGSELR